MLVSIAAGYVGALAAPLLHRASPRAAASFCSGLPLVLFLYFLSLTGSAGNGGIASTFSWVPSLGVNVSFRSGKGKEVQEQDQGESRTE